jgi:biopolymer transport protein ExbD
MLQHIAKEDVMFLPNQPKKSPRPPSSEDALIAAINTTPLIDVMLVLLIMFIMIIPVTTHKVPVDLASGPGRSAPPQRLDIRADGSLAWNGSPLAPAALAGRLAALAADPARPVLHLNAHGEARYERVDQILAQIRTAGITRLGFVDQQRFAGAIDR